jgi:Tol biopolymer transport system component
VLSPDGKRVALGLGDPRSDIWIFDTEHGSRTRLTFDDASHQMPSWSADGQRVAFVSQLGATVMAGTSLHAKSASGGGQDELLLDRKDADGSPVSLAWPQWSPDGRYLLYLQQSGPTGASVWTVPTSGEKKPQLVVKPEAATGKVTFLRLSPDGRWLAYSSNDGGREEVYVTSFPSGGGRWQISREGGTFPVWRHDGKEVFFIGLDAHLYAVEVNAEENRFEVGNSQALFELRNIFALGSPFDITPDGKRFMVLTQPEGSASPMMLVLNWTAELK